MARSPTPRMPPRETGYDYIKRMYGLDYRVGQRVQLERSDRVGTVTRMSPSAGHHVQVRFDGERHASPCHPNSLTILPEPTHEHR